ncbi:MAG: TRZ/ATZ family hydrolase [Gammaproteobacteria bacterium]|jgi:5-methylthioadenosine/S-adenosylhomocysteine deaminase|nr:TRZ/ATZ family hydrolase [Gammaproteobacteria bacterium]
MQAADLIIEARWIVPVVPAHTCLENAALAVADGRILALGPAGEIARAFEAAEIRRFENGLLIPGLVNTHTHAAMTVMRGLADDLPLQAWLSGHIWPAEGHHAGPEMIRDGVQLAIAEMQRGGTTCFNDMYFFPDEVARTSQQLGMRATVGMILIEFETAWAKHADEYIAKGLAVHDETRHLSLVRTAFAPHAPYTVSDGPLERIRVLADELQIPVHMHLHETAHEVEESIAKFGVRPLERIERLGLLGPRLVAVHMTQLLNSEIEAIAGNGVSVVHCPESNLKLASGLCPLADLDAAGANLALGTDGAASNNDLDMLGEMRSAALLAKGVARDATVLPAHRVLEMATLGGARALGWDDEIGSLEAGKAADLVLVDLDAPETQPVYDPVSQLVYAAGREQVSDVWIAGQAVLRNRELLRVDLRETLDRARKWRERLKEYA